MADPAALSRWALAIAPAIAVCSVFPSMAKAQVMGGADFGIQQPFIWRGLTRSNQASFQPSGFLGYKGESLVVTGGAWASIEPFSPEPGDFTNVGLDGGALGEVDYWGQIDWRLVKLVTLDVSAGWTGYTFHGDSARGGRGGEWNTSELYVKFRITKPAPLLTLARVPRDLLLGLELSLWKDIGAVGGAYTELVLDADFPILPLGEPLNSFILRLVSGWSFNQEDVPGVERGYYDGNGPTHLDFSVAPVLFFPLGGAGLTAYLAGHLQVGFDEATRRTGFLPDDRSTVRLWWQLTFSLLGPLRRTP